VIYLSKGISWFHFVLEQKPTFFLLAPGVFYPGIQTLACTSIGLRNAASDKGHKWSYLEINSNKKENEPKPSLYWAC